MMGFQMRQSSVNDSQPTRDTSEGRRAWRRFHVRKHGIGTEEDRSGNVRVVRRHGARRSRYGKRDVHEILHRSLRLMEEGLEYVASDKRRRALLEDSCVAQNTFSGLAVIYCDYVSGAVR